MNHKNHSSDKDEFLKNLQSAGGEIAGEMNFPDATDFTREEVRAEYASASVETLSRLEQVIVAGNLGVAENGAIWLEDKDLPHRVVPFITQHLIIKLNPEKIVPTMKEAYEKIQLGNTGFGVFISGPSKTADIEQSLVYGAHGAVRMTVIIKN